MILDIGRSDAIFIAEINEKTTGLHANRTAVPEFNVGRQSLITEQAKNAT
jgi:hypothetical protein